MKISRLHPWNVSIKEAKAIQLRLASKVSCTTEPPEYVVGTDISPSDARGVAQGAAVVMCLPEIQVVEAKCA